MDESSNKIIESDIEIIVNDIKDLFINVIKLFKKLQINILLF